MEEVYFTLSVVEILLFEYFVCIQKIRKSWNNVFGATVILVIANIVIFLCEITDGNSVFFSLVISLLLSLAVLDVTATQAIVYWFFTQCYMGLFTVFSRYILLFFDIQQNYIKMKVIIIIITCFLIVVVGSLLKSNRIYVECISTAKNGVILVSSFFVFAVDLLYVYADGMLRYDTNIKRQRIIASFGVICYFIMCFVGYLIIFLMYYNERLYKETNEKNILLEREQKYYYELRNSIENVKAIKHDMNYHLQNIFKMAKSGNNDGLVSYINDIMGIEGLSQKISIITGNNMIDSLIFDLKTVYSDIEVIYSGILPNEEVVSSFDFSTIIDNLIINAMEAAALNDVDDKRIVWIYSYVHSDSYIIKVCNYINKKIDTNMLVGNSSKNDKNNHGYGLMNVQKSVNRIGGTFKIDVKNDMLEAKVIVLR